jgi:hypothetical protein
MLLKAEPSAIHRGISMLKKIWIALMEAVGVLLALWASIPAEAREIAIKTAAGVLKEYFGRKYDEHNAAKGEQK